MNVALGTVVRPAVVGADMGLSVSAYEPANHGPAVAARVEQAMDLAVGIARDDHRLAPDAGGQEVVRLEDLSL